MESENRPLNEDGMGFYSRPQVEQLPNGSWAAHYPASDWSICHRDSAAHGEIRAAVDLRLVIDAFVGTRALVLGGPLNHDFSEAVVDLLINGMAPNE